MCKFIPSAGSERQNQNHNLNSFSQVLGILASLPVLLISCHFILSFLFVWSLSRSLDHSLLLHFYFEDYLRAGIDLNVFLAVWLTLMSLMLMAVHKIFPWADELVASFQLTLKKTKKVIPSAIVVLLLIASVLTIVYNLNYVTDEYRPSLLSLHFVVAGLLAGLAVLFGLLYLRIKFLGPALVFLFAAVANLNTGQLVAENILRNHANVRIHLSNAAKDPIIGTFVMFVDKGVIYMPSELCDRPTNTYVQIVSWSAISFVENISASAESCPSVLGHVRPPSP